MKALVYESAGTARVAQVDRPEVGPARINPRTVSAAALAAVLITSVACAPTSPPAAATSAPAAATSAPAAASKPTEAPKPAATTAPAAQATAAPVPTAGEAAAKPATKPGGKVFMLLPNTTTIRFTQRDAPLFVDDMKKYSPDTQVVVQNAEGDPAKQQRLTEDAIASRASAIVLVSADANLAGGILNTAATAKVPVILYDHDAKGGPAAAQVVFDALSVGREQGKAAAQVIGGLPGDHLKVIRVFGQEGEYGTTQYFAGQAESLDPLVQSGKIDVVCQQYTPNWDPATAQSFVADCLTKQNNKIDAIVVMNDGLAGGSIAALAEQNLAGKIPVIGGQDANLEALQYIALGYQHDTVYKDLRLLADAAAQVTAAIISGTGLPANLINGKVDNGYMQVPAVFRPVQSLTMVNLSKIVDDGVWKWSDICTGPAAKTKTCEGHS